MGLFCNHEKKKEAEFMAPQWLKIANDCATLVNTTVKPEVFFPRYDLMLEELNNLAETEKYIKYHRGKSPSAQLRELIVIRERETDTFIERATENAVEKAGILKTEAGKANSLVRFFKKMESFENCMTPKNRAHLQRLKEQHQK